MTCQLQVASGTILASAPDLRDPNFMHSISIMCEHADEGAYGLVVNKQSSLTIDRLLPEHPVFGRLDLPVWWGGPVGTDTLQILHRIPELDNASHSLAKGLFLGADLAEIAEFMEGLDARQITDRCRFVLGYAGWGAGQLEMEIRGGSWLPVEMDSELVFAYDQESTWQRAVRSLGAEGVSLAAMPPELGWN